MAAAVAPAAAEAKKIWFKASTPTPLAPVVFIDPKLAPPDHEAEEEREEAEAAAAAGGEPAKKDEAEAKEEEAEKKKKEEPPAPPTGSQPAVNSLGDPAGGICTAPGSPLIQLLGAIGNIKIDATEYEKPLPTSARRRRLLLFEAAL